MSVRLPLAATQYTEETELIHSISLVSLGGGFQCVCFLVLSFRLKDIPQRVEKGTRTCG